MYSDILSAIGHAHSPSRVLLSLKPSQVDIDAEDEDGWTPLHAAVYWGNAEIAEDLVDHGADVNKKTQLVRLYSRLHVHVVCIH